MRAVEDVGTPGAPRSAVLLKVVPGGSRDQVAGLHGDRVRVKVSAPPEGGKANKAVVALLARHLGVSRGAVTITRGASAPLKTVEIEGLSAAAVGDLLYGGPQ